MATKTAYVPDVVTVNGRRCGLPYARWSGYFLVMQQDKVLLAYWCFYFRSTEEVVADLAARLESGRVGGSLEDYVVWWNGRVTAVVSASSDDNRMPYQILFPFGDTHDPGWIPEPFGGFPTFEEWEAAGRPETIQLDVR